jgi:hypothetical protein
MVVPPEEGLISRRVKDHDLGIVLTPPLRLLLVGCDGV